MTQLTFYKDGFHPEPTQLEEVDLRLFTYKKFPSLYVSINGGHLLKLTSAIENEEVNSIVESHLNYKYNKLIEHIKETGAGVSLYYYDSKIRLDGPIGIMSLSVNYKGKLIIKLPNNMIIEDRKEVINMINGRSEFFSLN